VTDTFTVFAQTDDDWEAETAAAAATHRAAPLTPADLEVLEFARLDWRYLGAQDAAVQDRFDHSLTRFNQRLRSVLDKHAAAAYDPQLVHRLQRLQATRSGHRTPTIGDPR